MDKNSWKHELRRWTHSWWLEANVANILVVGVWVEQIELRGIAQQWYDNAIRQGIATISYITT